MNGLLRLLTYKPLLMALPVALLAAASVSAQPVNFANGGTGTIVAAPTAEEAEAAFRAARQGFLTVASGGADVSSSLPSDAVAGTVLISGTTQQMIPGGNPQNVSLEHIRIMLDVSDVTLRDVMSEIVAQAAQYTGPWTVKWRLSPENARLLDERMNLTAESDFGSFSSLLAERVKNMTGTQLFVTVFGGTRVLLIADTYY